MSFRIVADSCCDRTAFLKKRNDITFVPLTLTTGNLTVKDDRDFHQQEFIEAVKSNGNAVKTACPPPALWAQAFDCEEEEIYVMTITDKLSGSFNSARQGVSLYTEEHPESKKRFYLFNSLGTSGIESLIAERIISLKENGASFDETVSQTEDFILNHCALYFCLESLEALKQNGRLYAVAASVLEKVRLKLIFRRTGDGNIAYAAKEFQMNRALSKLAEIVTEDIQSSDVPSSKIVISYVCNRERAETLAEKIHLRLPHAAVEITACSGLNSCYASDGGIIVSYTK